MTDERSITPEAVREQHLRDVHQPSQWLYVAAVLGLGFLVMLAFIGFMGANAS